MLQALVLRLAFLTIIDIKLTRNKALDHSKVFPSL